LWLQAWRKIRAIYAKHDPSKLKNIEKMKQTSNTEKKEAKVLPRVVKSFSRWRCLFYMDT
jgi:hypothetical protein